MPSQSTNPIRRLHKGRFTDGHVDRSVKILMLCLQFPNKKPKHTDKICVMQEDPCTFGAGKFLNRLARHFIGNVKNRPLSDVDRSRLVGLPWFHKWLVGLKARRAASSVSNTTLDETVNTLIDMGHMNKKSMQDDDPISFVDQIGNCCEIQLTALLEDIAGNFSKAGLDAGHANHLSAKTMHRIRKQVPWVRRWAIGEKVLSDRLIPKDAKVELVIFHYLNKPPGWHDALTVCAPRAENGMVLFYPGYWLDDLLSNWVEPWSVYQPTIVLTADQRGALEKLPWFKDWICGFCAGE
jgi:hypothetical protein